MMQEIKEFSAENCEKYVEQFLGKGSMYLNNIISCYNIYRTVDNYFYHNTCMLLFMRQPQERFVVSHLPPACVPIMIMAIDMNVKIVIGKGSTNSYVTICIARYIQRRSQTIFINKL